ncbi:WD40 repeat-like protein [Neoconidiobolus thromboides FSU 785]|nr:WD40 repeat-like protein [Neoconidiobolus thromboides FSU 785]
MSLEHNENPSSLIDIRDGEKQVEIIQLILQYLDDLGFQNSKLVLADEASSYLKEKEIKQVDIERMKGLIVDGEWLEVEKLLQKPVLKLSIINKSLHYQIYKQQYLELIELHETQKAFNLLNKRLKPLETQHVINQQEFKDLCYLLTCNSVQEHLNFKSWLGISKERENLCLSINNLLNLEHFEKNESQLLPTLPPNRLLTLLNQAVHYQVNKYEHLKNKSQNNQIDSLFIDYEPIPIPNKIKHILKGHHKNVKSICNFNNTNLVASAGSDTKILIWNLNNDNEVIHPTAYLEGHQARIWELSNNNEGHLLASASADKTVKLWCFNENLLENNGDINVNNKINNITATNSQEYANNHNIYDLKLNTHSNYNSMSCIKTYSMHSHDVYTVKFHPNKKYHLASAGYDKKIQLFDINRENSSIKQFNGHQLAVTSITFNPNGNLLISGSKDCSVKLYDISSGLNIKTLGHHLGELTSVQSDNSGLYLLTSSKDNNHRLWDMRMLNKPKIKFKGHQNTSKHFIKARFIGNQFIASGSENSNYFIWDRFNGNIVNELNVPNLNGTVYDAAYNTLNDSLVVCSDSNDLVVWGY